MLQFGFAALRGLRIRQDNPRGPVARCPLSKGEFFHRPLLGGSVRAI